MTENKIDLIDDEDSDEEGCSFCGGDCRSLVTADEVSICEICCRNILCFFDNRRKEMIKRWEDEPDFKFSPGDDEGHLH